jgi:putative ABC transport system ATP-binding protein
MTATMRPARTGNEKAPDPAADVRVRDLTVEFPSPDYVIRPLDRLSFDADDGELVVVLGPSGCGKTTLLSCLSGLLTPTSGSISFGATEVTALSGRAMAEYRRHMVGVVFQAFNLSPSLSALRNVMAPLQVAGLDTRAARTKASELLDMVGLGTRLSNRPAQLSGGQQQRVAIARALVHDPWLIIADEPTAHLDYVQVDGILHLIRELATPGRVVIVATHDDRISRIADRVINLAPREAPIHVEPRRVVLYPGEVLFEQGDVSDLVYVVESGEIEIFRVNAADEHVRLTVVPPGGYFGELGPLLNLPRSASARATCDTSLIGFPPDQFVDRTKGFAAPQRRSRDPVGAGAPRRPLPYPR